jgi:transcriptional antiterminator
LEIAEAVLEHAEANFDHVDHNIVFPMADHLEYAAKRIEAKEEISNPLLNDIKILFHAEYKTAEIVKPLLKDKLNLDISEDEIGYVALHIHSATSLDKLSQSIETAQAVRNCISQIEEITQKTISVESLSYNRMMNHIRYMVARIQKSEPLKVNMNDYVLTAFPQSFEIAKSICEELSNSLGAPFDQLEIGYLAMHIERVKADVMDN